MTSTTETPRSNNQRAMAETLLEIVREIEQQINAMRELAANTEARAREYLALAERDTAPTCNTDKEISR